MQYDDNEEKGNMGFGYCPPGAADDIKDPQNVGEAPDRGSYENAQVDQADISFDQNGAPVNQVNAPIDQFNTPADKSDVPVSDTALPLQQASPGYNREPTGEQVFTPYIDNWREPAYSQTHETTQNMYTPGICVDHPLARRRNADVEHERKPREHRGRLGRYIRAVCLMLVCVILSGAAAYVVMDYRFKRGDFTVVNQVTIGGRGTSQPGDSLLFPVSTAGNGMLPEDIYDVARTHVVKITTEATGTGTGGIYGMQGPTAISTGSGFIISSDGYILTNYHVIETSYVNNLPLYVYLTDESQYEATIIGFEKSNDFAVIKIDATGLNPAVIGDSDSIRVGQRVYAVGNPLGDLTYTMTDGIISALNRTVTVDRKSINTFQISAAVNSGNSGGPVYNANGEVIGIVTAKLMSDTVEGIGFAIPINDAIQIASELIEHGYISGRALIGVTVETVNSGHAEFYNWVVGAVVRSVMADSAADTAGIEVGDIIVGLGDTKIDSSDSLVYALRKYKPGDTAKISVWRDGDEIDLTITFGENLAAGQPQ